MTRHERYQALKVAVSRAGLACLAIAATERTADRANGLMRAWERIGKLVYPMPGDYGHAILTNLPTR